ncbi:FAD-dependent oxidoreductase [Halorientalis sp. IM1011]|uniref:FAD-dependent oxidoreductase n=1 Tax=Halorientalis sp. IM1011 TaxID=1932360 RepID=UPI000A040745|nr:FAD-dependent oxidoreductase [Halorientalis sp. IM1011]
MHPEETRPKGGDTTDNGDGVTDGGDGHRSLWLAEESETQYGPLTDDLTVDTVVVGGGIVGITTAYHLATAGQSVALLERDRLLGGTTGHTTAKLTSLHGLRYADLLERRGETRAREYAEANEAAIDRVERLVDDLGVDCEFERTEAYTYVTDRDRVSRVREEVRAAERLDLPASLAETTDLPFEIAGAVRFDSQARFDPATYLQELAAATADSGGRLFERTTATGVSGGSPCRVETDRGTITADAVAVATNFPITDHAGYFARMTPKRSYVLAVRLRDEPPEGLYYDPTEPYFSVRPRPGDRDSLALIGGQNHRTGHGGSTAARYRRLESQARDRFDVEAVEYRWSTQDFRTFDDVPFVGTLPVFDEGVYVATGFGGWGMTNGTAAARQLADRILGRDPEWSRVFRPTRVTLGVGPFVSHNAQAARHLLSGRFGQRTTPPAAALDPGEAGVFRRDGEQVAAYRDADGRLYTRSAVCPHLGCLVEWNDGERSWDCPCHGSRFDVDGTVLDAPAVQELEPVDVRPTRTERDRRPSAPSEED